MTAELTGGVRLSPKAEADLEDIWRFGAAKWSPAEPINISTGSLRFSISFWSCRELPGNERNLRHPCAFIRPDPTW